jgi:cyclopropane fatty-acyl-phospholipid synthase-like methyltransferase
MRNHPPGRALDLGCGTGTNSMTMAGFGWSVLGIDISALAIYFARRKACRSEADVHFIRGDVVQMGNQGQPFDLVLDIGCFHALPIEKRDAYIQHLEGSTKFGSDFLLYTWINARSDDPLIAPTEVGLREYLSPNFDVMDVTYGTDHGRTSAWILATRPT